LILLETSALIEAWRKNGRADAKARVESALRSGRAALCQPVVLELSAGMKKEAEFKLLQDYLDVLPLLPITDEVWRLAASRARLFRSHGLTLSNFDILIFATAEHHNANIVTLDRHFAQMREVLRNGN
jgi:predicted nucleic acid-binding protein